MKFANPFLGIADSPFVDLFEIVIQLAAIASVVVIYKKRFFDFKHYSFYLKLIVAVIPALLFGALLKKYIDAVLDNLWVIATVMVLGGIALIFIDRYFKKQVEFSNFYASSLTCRRWSTCRTSSTSAGKNARGAEERCWPRCLCHRCGIGSWAFAATACAPGARRRVSGAGRWPSRRCSVTEATRSHSRS